MAQLIKLDEYASRYEYDLKRYTSQFTRLKREKWYYLENEWRQRQLVESEPNDELDDEDTDWFATEPNKFVQLFQKMKRKMYTKDAELLEEDLDEEEKQLPSFPATLEALKQKFLEETFHSQLRWASTSLLEESRMHPKYKWDEWLRTFVTQIPDNYLLMYKPVFFIKNAPIQLDIVLLSPTEVYCITLLEGTKNSVFSVSSERFWLEYIEKKQRKRLSPLITLNRTTSVVGPILKKAGSTLPVKKVVLATDGFFDLQAQGHSVEYIDKRRIASWMEKLKRHSSPLKKNQVMAAEALLAHCQTVAIPREPDEEILIDEEPLK
ncbi:nuclease-related domain-containing protein [Halalkalibacterium halodurans]|uniref:nuclease-related domain-containing protein n=1 Tax=Halalkalibacterium halodurans TaxID=86665 RepID=UPI002AA9F0C9|nr:nuclease-related domain-containing protein [Halalkalibacterium halodurans]MDY7223799.1 nuclease-related domain-containing protein [Halalkalibacterium halodurans]MDY7243020.1 nuclease-related domain-containing protein [Halalkalibacterium halodurans]